MLAKANRLVSADDYRRLVRRGRRVVGEHTVVYSARASSSPASSDEADPAGLELMGPARIGFIVPKTVGIAVTRNLIRRRLKAMMFEALPTLSPGTEVVIRALPGAAQVSWDTLRFEVSQALAKGVMRA